MGWLDNWSKTEQPQDKMHRETPGELTLKEATIKLADPASRRQRIYARILVDEVYKRSRCGWDIMADGGGSKGKSPPSATTPVIVLRVDNIQSTTSKEAYRVETDARANLVTVTGASDRGLLFGVGRLLRLMNMDFQVSYSSKFKRVCSVAGGLIVISQPDYWMRQHQIAFRPKTNSYDAFTEEQMRQEILDLALFGCNAIEMIPPGLDDAAQSPHFKISWLDMLSSVSEWCDDLDLRVSMWYPAFLKNWYFDEEKKKKVIEIWDEVFSRLKRFDVLFVPGGDPGGRPAEELFAIVEMQARHVRSKWFPKCEVWVSTQYGLSVSVDLGLARWDGKKRIAEWLETIKTPRVRSFLTGVVYGPWTVMTIEEFREAVPDYYPLRHYPDLCHSASCQFPVDGWGWQLGGAHLREGINPRPLTFQRIFRDTASLTIGCGCYSEGMQDDVNKYIWLILHWGADNTGKGMNKKVPTRASEMPDKQLSNVLYKGLLDYVTLLMGQNRFAEEAVKCIYSLEKNWTYAWLNEENSGLSTRQGSAVTYSTAALALDLDGKCQPRHRLNWRFNLLLFRAFFDAHIVAKFEAEDMLERRAFALIRNANPDNVATTLTQLISLADEARFPAGGHAPLATPPNALREATFKERLYLLAGQLYCQVGYQSSIALGGQHRQRGSDFDGINLPLSTLPGIELVAKSTAANLSQPGVDKVLRRKAINDLRQLLPSDPHDDALLWRCSFGDELDDRIGVPAASALGPTFKPVELGEDPTYFKRPLTEFIATDHDVIHERLLMGNIPRNARSWLVNIWPSAEAIVLRFPTSKLPVSGPIVVRVVFIGKLLCELGGDWEEIGRECMPARVLANGKVATEWINEPPTSAGIEGAVMNHEFVVEHDRTLDYLLLEFKPKFPKRVAVNMVMMPIAEVALYSGKPGAAKL